MRLHEASLELPVSLPERKNIVIDFFSLLIFGIAISQVCHRRRITRGVAIILSFSHPGRKIFFFLNANNSHDLFPSTARTNLLFGLNLISSLLLRGPQLVAHRSAV